MKTQVDFSEKITPQTFAPLSFEDRLNSLCVSLCRAHNKKKFSQLLPADLLKPYARGYLDDNATLSGYKRTEVAIARLLMFLRMEQGKPTPYIYKKLDQDLSASTVKIFDDGERPPLEFTKAQQIEAVLLGRKFGLENCEEETLEMCIDISKNLEISL
jgi:hypothetical protein|tara:strand:+ start:857 stop:1330 length:474 start_codon:yes stop_codon:yes gene_type:complete